MRCGRTRLRQWKVVEGLRCAKESQGLLQPQPCGLNSDIGSQGYCSGRRLQERTFGRDYTFRSLTMMKLLLKRCSLTASVEFNCTLIGFNRAQPHPGCRKGSRKAGNVGLNF